MKGNFTFRSWIKRFTPIFAFLALVSLAMLIFSFTRPMMTREDILENTIHIKTDYQLVEKVPPNLLFPNGTTLYPDKTLTSSLSGTFLINEKVTVTSDKPVEIKAASDPVLNIENVGIWKKDYPIGSKKTFDTNGFNSSFTIEMVIPAKELFSYLDQVETKLNMHSNQYVFHVKPQLKGSVIYQGTSIDLGADDSLDFDHNQNELTLQENEKLSNTKSYPIKSLTNKANTLLYLQVKTARILFTILAFLFTVLWLLARDNKKQGQPEYKRLDRKYEKLIAHVYNRMNVESSMELKLQSFKDLLLISDEKETPICRFENEHEVIYFVPDHQFVYSYSIPIEGRSRKR